jgi:hypothetical protein
MASSVGWFTYACWVGGVDYIGGEVSWGFFAYSCCRSYVHLDWPSMSSKNFNRLRVLSTEVFNYCTVGTRCGYFPPAASSLIFAPIAAWSCFSTAVIFSCSLSTSTCLQVSIVI